MKLTSLAVQDLAEPRRVEVEGVGPEMGEVLVELCLRDEPHAGSLLLPRLCENELCPVEEAHAEHRRLRSLRAGREVAQPPGAHEVDAHDEILASDRKQEVLAAPVRALEAAAVERRERGVEGLQRRDVRRAGLLDRRTRYQWIELAHPRLHLGQLGHPVTVAP